MKQFTKDELLDLKYQIAMLVDPAGKDADKDPVRVYYTSLEVLQYFNSLPENEVSLIDLNFWLFANKKSTWQMLKVEGEYSLLFKEKMKFEEALAHAQYFYATDLHNKKVQNEYYKLVDQVEEARKDYAELRQVAGVYLDILSENVDGERYQMWRKFYDCLSDAIDEKRRGFDQADWPRLSLQEIELLIDEVETDCRFEKKKHRILLYWTPLLDNLKALAAERKAL